MSTNGFVPPGDEGNTPESPETTPKKVDLGANTPESPPAAATDPEAGPVSDPEPAPVAEPKPAPVAKPVVEPAAAVATVAAAGSAQALIQEYQSAVKWNSLIRVIFPVFVLALIITFGAVTAANIMGAFPEKRITQETVKAGEELMPILNNVLRAFVDDVALKLAKEFQRGLEEGGERLAITLGQELDRLQSSSGEKIKERIHVALEMEKGKHKALLLELYPELKEDPEKLDKLVGRLSRAFEMWTVKYLLGVLEDYYLAMAKINDTVIKGYRPDPAMQGKSVREGEMLELFMELMNAAYAETPEGVAVADEPEPAEAVPAAAVPAEAVPAGEAAGVESELSVDAATEPETE